MVEVAACSQAFVCAIPFEVEDQKNFPVQKTELM